MQLKPERKRIASNKVQSQNIPWAQTERIRRDPIQLSKCNLKTRMSPPQVILLKVHLLITLSMPRSMSCQEGNEHGGKSREDQRESSPVNKMQTGSKNATSTRNQPEDSLAMDMKYAKEHAMPGRENTNKKEASQGGWEKYKNARVYNLTQDQV